VSDQLIPISNLTLNVLEVGFTSMPDRMRVSVTVADIIGSSFRLQGDMYEELGIIKQLDVRRLHSPRDLVELKDLVRLFYVSEADHTTKGRKLNDLTVFFEKRKKGDSVTEIMLESLAVSLQLRPLLTLSKLAALDDSVKPPKPRLPSEAVPVQPGENRLRLTANSISFLAATEQTGQQLGLSGQFLLDLTSKPPLNKTKVIE